MKSVTFRVAVLALLAVAVVTATIPSRAQDQAAQPATAGLPPGIDPKSQTAEVMKLVQAGLDPTVVAAYISNATSTFNLDADQIITLKDAGVPSTTINAMMDHDRNLAANSAPTPNPSNAPAPVPSMPDNTAPPTDGSATPVAYSTPDATADDAPDTAPPPPVTIDYFNQNLNGYGSWIVIPGYGRCWRPTTVLTDPSWRPYCDHGHWVYTDCGWYWASDYSWGATFHYGRWFRHPGFGWCWYPDLEWAPSWVSWRSSDYYCGWAPLPPFAIYRPGAGFFYRGAIVSVDFDFGLGDDVFIFVDHDHFCDRRPRQFCLDSNRGRDVFHRTTIINHFDVREDRDRHDRVVVNAGIPVEKVRPHNGGDIHAVAVGALPNARREGWRGQVTVPQYTGPGRLNPSAPKTSNASNIRTSGINKDYYNQGVTHANNNPAYGNGNSQTSHEARSVSPGQNTSQTVNNHFNIPGSAQPNKQGGNSNYSPNHQPYHVVSQSPGGATSTARYTSPNTPTTTTGANNSVNPVYNNNYNNNHTAQPGKTFTPGSGSFNPRPQSQFQWPQDANQTRPFNNNYNAAGNARPAYQPPAASVPQSTQPVAPHAAAPAYTAPVSNARNNTQNSSGNSGSGNQSHNSSNNNNNQQNH